jgi:hypothetical protein
MIGQNAAKWGIVAAPAAIVDNASLTTNVIDTLGYDRLEVILVLGALDIAVTAFSLQESNVKASDTALTSGTDITGAVGGTDFTLPIATDDSKIGVIDLNMVSAPRKRYIDVTATLGDGAAGTYSTIIFRLSKGHVDPISASDAGLLFRQVVA